MTKSKNPIPAGYRTITPSIAVKGAAKAEDLSPSEIQKRAAEWTAKMSKGQA